MTAANVDRKFGEDPLPQTVAAAAALRRITELLLAQEFPQPVVDDMLARFVEWESALAATAPPDRAPRLADDDARKRIYLQHAFNPGAYNPCFPEYRFDHLDEATAAGTVTFPAVFEGPPGLVHGGFLGVFFDTVAQHQSCAVALAGKTRSLTVTYRRPTPILTELDFDITRTETEAGLLSTARLLLGGEVLCVGEISTVALPPTRLAGSRFGKRRG
ncbi:hypothetical protein [Mycolicibacterium thermoresistibile]